MTPACSRPGAEDEQARELLLCCARTDLAPAQQERLRQLVTGPLDWSHVVRTAHRHGIAALLHHHLHEHCPDEVPPAVASRLRLHHLRNAARNELLVEALCRATELLEDHGIRTLAFKGPTLARQTQRQLDLRESADLDVLVDVGDVPAALALLQSKGWQSDWNWSFSGLERFVLSRTEHEICLMLPGAPRVYLDLHWRLAPGYLAWGLCVEALRERSALLPFEQGSVRTLSPGDHLHLLCVHGAKDGWDRLGRLVDVAELVRCHRQLPWDRLVAEARAAGSLRRLLLGCLLAHDLLEAPVPPGLICDARADTAVARLSRQVDERLQPAPEDWGMLRTWRFQVHTLERAADRVRYRVGLPLALAAPTTEERKLISLPAWLLPLYYPIRAGRLATKHAARFLRRRGSGRL